MLTGLTNPFVYFLWFYLNFVDSEDQRTGFQDFRNSLNKFFMHFVSEMVFAPGIAPDIEIVKWLTNCVTFRDQTKKFSLFTTAEIVDPNPVLRSFLIKLFLQCQSSEAIKDHLNELITNFQTMNSPHEMLPNLTLVMNCHKVSAFVFIDIKCLYDHMCAQLT